MTETQALPTDALQQAMELFWIHGYHAVSIDDLVRRTGLSRHAIYARYGSKLGLLKAVLCRYRDGVLEHIQATLDGVGTYRERIEKLLSLRPSGPTDDVWDALAQRGCLVLRVAAELWDAHADLAEDL